MLVLRSHICIRIPFHQFRCFKSTHRDSQHGPCVLPNHSAKVTFIRLILSTLFATGYFALPYYTQLPSKQAFKHDHSAVERLDQPALLFQKAKLLQDRLFESSELELRKNLQSASVLPTDGVLLIRLPLAFRRNTFRESRYRFIDNLIWIGQGVNIRLTQQ